MRSKKGMLPGLNVALAAIGGVIGIIILANILGSTTGMVTTAIKSFNTSLVGILGTSASGLSGIILYVFGFGAVLALIAVPLYVFFKNKDSF